MKKLFFVAIILICSATVHASSDYTVTWQIDGYLDATSIKLDLNVGNDFVSANGALITDTGVFVLVTGTCDLTIQGGIFCSLNIGQGNSGALDIGSNLNGALRVINVDGIQTHLATAILSDVIEGN